MRIYMNIENIICNKEDYLIEMPEKLNHNEFFIDLTNIIVKREQRLADINREKLNRKGIWSHK